MQDVVLGSVARAAVFKLSKYSAYHSSQRVPKSDREPFELGWFLKDLQNAFMNKQKRQHAQHIECSKARSKSMCHQS